MALSEHELKISTGRRQSDGRVRVYLFTENLLALTLEDYGERAPTLLLTRSQAERLREALGELIPELKEAEPEEASSTDVWQGQERRTTGALR